MTHFGGSLKFDDIRERVYGMITNNTTNRDNPYLILVRTAGTNVEYVKLLVYRNQRPWKDARAIQVASRTRIVWGMNAYVGLTPRSSIHTRLPLAIEAREFFNMLHRIEHKKQRVTVEMMRAVTTPHLKQKLIEACCLAAL